MSQLPECRARTHKGGKGSRKVTWEGGTGERRTQGRGWREAQRVSYCHWVGGASRFRTFQKQKQKTKTKTKNPKYYVKLRKLQRDHTGLQPLSLKSNENNLMPCHCCGCPDASDSPVTTGAPGCALLCSRFPALKSHTHSTHSDTPPLPRGRAAGHVRAHTPYTQGETAQKINLTTSTAIGHLDCFHNFPLKYYSSRK